MNRVEAARRNASSAQQGLAEKERVLRRLVGLAEDAPLVLSPEFPVPKLTLGLDECIQIALENSFTLWDQQYSLELQERQLETARISGTPPSTYGALSSTSRSLGSIWTRRRKYCGINYRGLSLIGRSTVPL